MTDRPSYPEGDVVGPCVCGSWPGGKCLKCPWIPAPAQPDPLHVANEQGEEVKDASRYRRFFDAGLPITFMGVEYEDKASLDAAMDADLAQEGKT